jgi:hypothetical protein
MTSVLVASIFLNNNKNIFLPSNFNIFNCLMLQTFLKTCLTRLRDGAYFFMRGGAQDSLCLLNDKRARFAQTNRVH